MLVLQKRSSVTKVPKHFHDFKNFENTDSRFYYSQYTVQSSSEKLHLTYVPDQ